MYYLYLHLVVIFLFLVNLYIFLITIEIFLKLYLLCRHFQPLNKKLIKAYQALSIMGYTYDNQNTFESAIVQYLKTNLVKSTRHLNVYKFSKSVFI